MSMTKHEFIKSFLPDKIEEVTYAQIDLDVTDLSLGDIFRNLNRTYPQNSRSRNAITSGTFAIGVLCKTETLDPMTGLFIILTDDHNKVEIVSKNYIVISVPESMIETDADIKRAIDKITVYLAKNFKETVDNFHDFYVKFIYDPSELDLDEQE